MREYVNDDKQDGGQQERRDLVGSFSGRFAPIATHPLTDRGGSAAVEFRSPSSLPFDAPK